VLASDLLALLDALSIGQVVLAGFDWGGRAACIVAALWPQRVAGLVTCGGDNIQDIARSGEPAPPEIEHRHWYQYYFHGARGRAGLARNRRDLCRLLWSLWSPDWRFDQATYAATAESFDNPDFVDVVIHSYRHRFALAPGDPAADEIERRLAGQPPITVPTVSIDGASDGVAAPGGTAHHARRFHGPYAHRTLPGVGHNAPQEAPADFAQAVLSLSPGAA
jgi:pimeloyl-ACP methyl ester carboxylesterase